MTTAIFIKSYHKDFQWLSHCLKSIQKFVTGYSEIVIAIPTTDSLDQLTAERVVKVEERGKGYYWQMLTKLNAHLYTDAAAIMFVDSDCIFSQPFDVSELFAEDGRLKLLHRPWSEAGTGITWKAPADKALGWDTRFCTMFRHPMAYHRETLTALRAHIEAIHVCSLEDYVLRQEIFIEFVTAGNFAHEKRPEQYLLVTSPDYPNPIKQYWSYAGIDATLENELQELLA